MMTLWSKSTSCRVHLWVVVTDVIFEIKTQPLSTVCALPTGTTVCTTEHIWIYLLVVLSCGYCGFEKAIQWYVSLMKNSKSYNHKYQLTLNRTKNKQTWTDLIMSVNLKKVTIILSVTWDFCKEVHLLYYFSSLWIQGPVPNRIQPVDCIYNMLP